MENVFHIFGTPSELELLEFLVSPPQEGPVELDQMVMSVGGLDHRLAFPRKFKYKY
jgi:hypothetical protein